MFGSQSFAVLTNLAWRLFPRHVLLKLLRQNKNLERLTKLQKRVEANQAGSELEKAVVDIFASIIAYTESSHLMKPADGTFDNPPVFT